VVFIVIGHGFAPAVFWLTVIFDVTTILVDDFAYAEAGNTISPAATNVATTSITQRAEPRRSLMVDPTFPPKIVET
jgi:hypothetical protein